jgi:hypothetical protein
MHDAMTSRRVMLLLSVLSVSCDGCGSCKNKAKAYLSEPPLEDYRREVEEQVPTAAKVATNVCGFSAAGLKDAKVTVAQESPKRLRVEGTPIPARGDVAVDKSKAAVCTGLVSVIAWPIVGDDDKVTGYKWDPIVLESVETPGVKWTKPGSGEGWD